MQRLGPNPTTNYLIPKFEVKETPFPGPKEPVSEFAAFAIDRKVGNRHLVYMGPSFGNLKYGVPRSFHQLYNKENFKEIHYCEWVGSISGGYWKTVFIAPIPRVPFGISNDE